MSKIIYSFVIFLTVTINVFAQAPQAFNYQAVTRDATGNPIVSHAIGVKININQSSALGATVYSETFTTITNQFGLFTLSIGKGSPITGTFSTISWNTGSYWLDVEIDPAGGTAYVDMGSAQLLSVPYAISSLSSQQLTIPGVTTGNLLTWNDSVWVSKPSSAISYTAGTGINIAGSTITNTAPDQTVTINSGTGISVTGTYPTFTATNTAPNQTVTITAGKGISITGTYPNFSVTNTAPNKTDTINAGNGISITGTYPNITIINTSGVPAGSIMAFGGDSTKVPSGWLLCNGLPYGTTAYPALFAAIGTNYGGSGGIFYVPDLRGRFLRGVDGGAGNDPDKALRKAMQTGGNTGNSVGSIEADAFQGHLHNVDAYSGPTGTAFQSWAEPGGYASKTTAVSNTFCTATTIISDGINGTPRITSETRPKNAYVYYIIKY